MLEIQAITKRFGKLTANDQVSLYVDGGTIHSLLGENGAGKSTLVKMLYGSLQPDGGKILWQGEPVSITSPSMARQLGIGMVFQHFSLFESLSVAENIALSLDSRLSLDQIGKKATQLSEEYGLPLKAETIVGDMSVGERQRVEIVRCLLQDPSLIILDEPTSVLTPQEADRLFETLDRLRSEGRSVLYISHRLEEVRAMCDHATILRHGKVVGECNPAEETAGSLASLMVGAEINTVSAHDLEKSEAVILNVDGLNMPKSHPFAVALKDISFSVNAGEIVGIAGIAGNGQGELFGALSGEDIQSDPSQVQIRGQDVGLDGISERRNLGAAFVPEERLGHGAVPDMSLSDNMLLSRHSCDASAFLRFSGPLAKLGIIAYPAVAQATQRVCEAMDVRKSGKDPSAGSLSGGNLQKFIVGRELDRQPILLVVNQPTWGVDAGAAANIRQALIDLASQGSAVLMISQDLDEILEIATAIGVMAEGRLSEVVPASTLNREKIGLLMARTHGDGSNNRVHNSGEAA